MSYILDALKNLNRNVVTVQYPAYRQSIHPVLIIIRTNLPSGPGSCSPPSS